MIVAVKAAHVPTVADKLPRLLTDRTGVLTIQNGVGSADVLAIMFHRIGYALASRQHSARLCADRAMPS